jgi:hypothetical protein
LFSTVGRATPAPFRPTPPAVDGPPGPATITTSPSLPRGLPHLMQLTRVNLSGKRGACSCEGNRRWLRPAASLCRQQGPDLAAEDVALDALLPRRRRLFDQIDLLRRQCGPP